MNQFLKIFLKILVAGALSFSSNSVAAPDPLTEITRSSFSRSPEKIRKLDGDWDFAYETDKFEEPKYLKTITVPFTRETEMSGINDSKFAKSKQTGWYRKIFTLGKNPNPNDRLLLNFGAVNYETQVWVNGRAVGTNLGGYSPFQFDITDAAKSDPDGQVKITVRSTNPIMSQTNVRGKQQVKNEEGSIWYKTSSGIKESVWLESVAESHIKKFKLRPEVSPDLKTGDLNITIQIMNPRENLNLNVSVKRSGQIVNTATVSAANSEIKLKIPISDLDLWSPDSPNLYDLEFSLDEGGSVIDQVKSYTGFKKLEVRKGIVFLNGKILYQQLILDQGYYNDKSGYTPTSATDAETDILMAKEAGFNGARFHQQTAPAYKRTLADTHGFLFWAELPSARDLSDPQAKAQAFIEADRLIDDVNNNPACIGMTFLNESWGIDGMSVPEKIAFEIEMLRYVAPKLRPDVLISINDGWEMISFVDTWGKPVPELADLQHLRGRLVAAVHEYPWYSNHLERYYSSYERSKVKSGTQLLRVGGRKIFLNGFGLDSQAPILLSEFGGVSTYFKEGGLPAHMMNYGPVERTVENFRGRVGSQLRIMGNINLFCGYCYTQLEDTLNETNGLLKNRVPKTPLSFFAKRQKAAARRFLSSCSTILKKNRSESEKVTIK